MNQTDKQIQALKADAEKIKAKMISNTDEDYKRFLDNYLFNVQLQINALSNTNKVKQLFQAPIFN